MEVRLVFLPNAITELPTEIFERCLSRLNSDSQARIRRFYHREDAWRSLIGMLLPYNALRDHGSLTENVQFARTSSGKPYLTSPIDMSFNVSHDKQLIAMVTSFRVETNLKAPGLGIDVMRRKIPKGETISSFVRAIDSTLSKSELEMFTPQLDHHTAEKNIFLLWTLKEAYTKALGLGLGFDFERIEYDIPNDVVHIDGIIPRGWHFIMFEIHPPNATDVYQGAVAHFEANDETSSLTALNA
ncbi:hypothetical protein Clacol_001555 [Clathrus columnatus]|uniref:holo-[acyl-carrier-protein] synthase n=1 Tax=Clathrus columnatus TaxID=1419009 RepID=A0AAV5A241_9AGAM|nr:hypothetical protein Clacol_001555 [Clathrus columnatus]